MSTNKSCIVSFANDKNSYINNLARLSNSLRTNSTGIDFVGFVGEASCNAPLHSDVPYGFKISAIQKVIENGYEKVLWLDSSCFAIAQVQPIFDEIEKDEFIFQDSGHWLGCWANDFSLNYFGITRDMAMDLRMIGNAGFLGFDFTKPRPNEFFSRWKQSMIDGCFTGAWHNNDKTESQDERCRGHRHDMVCSSALVHNMGLKPLMKGGEEWLQYAGIYDKTLNDTIIIKAQG